MITRQLTMKKQFSAVILGAALLVPSLATVAHANGLEDKYFTPLLKATKHLMFVV